MVLYSNVVLVVCMQEKERGYTSTRLVIIKLEKVGSLQRLLGTYTVVPKFLVSIPL